jgi:2'-5' RNA ligase
MQPRPLILTARFDPALFDQLDGLRRRYFPPERNFIPAHVTLFHDLPGAELDRIADQLKGTGGIDSVPCRLPALKFTGRGMHAVLECEPLRAIRAHVANRWRDWLSRQDQQPYRPHVTVQNKAEAAEARRDFEELNSRWQPLTGTIVGLDLWHYAGGPWEPAGKFALPGSG